jgi:hypothetical protein
MQPTPPIASGNRRCAAACGVHQDLAHGHARHGQEVSPVLPGGAGLIHQPEIGLVHQGRGVERLPRTKAAELPAGHGAQLVIDQTHQPVHRARVPLADSCQELCYLSRSRVLRALRHLVPAFRKSLILAGFPRARDDFNPPRRGDCPLFRPSCVHPG